MDDDFGAGTTRVVDSILNTTSVNGLHVLLWVAQLVRLISHCFRFPRSEQSICLLLPVKSCEDPRQTLGSRTTHTYVTCQESST